ncbi:MAG: hypothetical protein ACYDGU_13310, partial [Acidiferrobacterales bacterium]
SILAGHHRYAQFTGIREDRVHPALLGVTGLVSEDAARRALQRIDESADFTQQYWQQQAA